MYQPISVPDQNANNALKRYGNDDMCCDSYPTACQYDITIATAATVNNIKFKRTAEGETVTKTFTAVGGTAVVAAIKAALVAEGYEEDSDEVRGVTSRVVSSNTIYSITGSLIVVSMTHTTSTVVTPTTKCERVGICDHYITTAGGAANVFGVDGTDEDLGGLIIGTDNAAAVKAAIEGATAWPSGYTVAVTEDAELYYITINGPGPIVFSWNGNKFVKQDCVAGYIA
jgi:hypothetical protein